MSPTPIVEALAALVAAGNRNGARDLLSGLVAAPSQPDAAAEPAVRQNGLGGADMLRAATELLGERPRSALRLVALGWAHLAAGDASAATRALSAAIESDDLEGITRDDAFAAFAAHCLDSGQPRTAIAALEGEAGGAARRLSAVRLRWLSRAQEAAGDWADAALSARHLARREGGPPNWINAIRLQALAGPAGAVSECCIEAIEAPGADRSVFHHAALVCAAIQDFRTGEEAARRSVARSAGSDPFAWRALITSLLGQGRTPDALAAFEACALQARTLVCQREVFAALPDQADREALVRRLAEVCAIPDLGALVQKFAPDLSLPVQASKIPPRIVCSAAGVSTTIRRVFQDSTKDRSDIPSWRSWAPRKSDEDSQAIRLFEYSNVRLVIFQNRNFFILNEDGECMDIYTAQPYRKLAEHAMSLDYSDAHDSLFFAGGRSVTNNFAHWTFDILPRIAIAARELPGIPIGLGGYTGKSFQAGTMELFGLSHLNVFNMAPGAFRLKNLWILDVSARSFVRGLQDGNLDFTQALLSRRPRFPQPAVRRRLFLDRPPPQRRTLRNRAEVIARLKTAGFEAVDPGLLSNHEQARLLSEASHVVGIHGAALTNLVFCHPSCRVLEIHSPTHGTAEFGYAAAAVGCAYRPVFGRSRLPDDLKRLGINENFDIDMSVLEQGLEWLLGDRTT